MENKYNDFTERRMQIFNILVKKYWHGDLKKASDLERLALDIQASKEFNNESLSFIKNHIRVAMGLNPTMNDEFKDELIKLKLSENKDLNINVNIHGPCEFCEVDECECRMDGKYETSFYNKQVDTSYVSNCERGAYIDKIEFLPLIDLLKEKKTPVFAAVAPSIVGQFG